MSSLIYLELHSLQKIISLAHPAVKQQFPFLVHPLHPPIPVTQMKMTHTKTSVMSLDYRLPLIMWLLLDVLEQLLNIQPLPDRQLLHGALEDEAAVPAPALIAQESLLVQQATRKTARQRMFGLSLNARMVVVCAFSVGESETLNFLTLFRKLI
jgi:hypothetical protein